MGTYSSLISEAVKIMNLSTPRPESWGLLEVHLEPCFFTPPPKAELRVAEWVK
jgi:hypothetical protein